MWTISSSQNLINTLVSPADCNKRSRKCSVCKLNNSQASLQQMQELNLLSENLEIVRNGQDLEGNNKFFVRVVFDMSRAYRSMMADYTAGLGAPLVPC